MTRSSGREMDWPETSRLRSGPNGTPSSVARSLRNGLLDLNQFDRHGRLGAAQNDAEQQIVNALERGLAGVQLKIVDRFPAHKGGKQARQAEDVIEVGVGDEDAVEALEADAALKNLALGAVAAIHQKA